MGQPTNDNAAATPVASPERIAKIAEAEREGKVVDQQTATSAAEADAKDKDRERPG